MGVIRVLPDRLISQIAAGEVIERPASVVKELVENSLDAGARRIRVEAEAGGRKRIAVSDDGCGMVRDDALLALERHATSKLRQLEDLLAISTLGFRGEALPAIASISRMTLETAPAAGAGTRLTLAAGKLQQVEEAGLPAGTSIVVEDLFFNLPVRRKFLKSEGTELSHIAGVVTNYALAHPEIQFTLRHGGRGLLDCPAARDHGERLQQVLGAELTPQLLPVNDILPLPDFPDTVASPALSSAEESPAAPALALFGYLSRPELQKLNRNSIYIFVNRRLVRDRLLQHALVDAYRNLLPNNTFPVALLFVEMPYAEVDVNVHPQKTEVRFRHPSWVHDAVRDTLRRALGVARPVARFERELRARPDTRPAWLPPAPVAAAPEMQVSAADLGAQAPAGANLAEHFQLTAAAAALPSTQPLPLPLAFAAASQRPGTDVIAPEPTAGCSSLTLSLEAGAHATLAALHPLGQIHASFILAAEPGGFCVIDQHAAHERVLFEQIRERRLQRQLAAQQLLIPALVELDATQWARYAEIAGELAENGFESEPFGGRTLAVKAAPAGIAAEQAQRLLTEILEISDPRERGFSREQAGLRIAATIACHAAIKVNMPLTDDKMRWLLQALAATRHPMTCPHGRPVMLRYSLAEIQRAFKRI